ncbi:MAG: helix-turn-helix domain-containing protein [Desulforhopalus sp.]
MNSTNPELQLADAFVRETGCNIFLTGKAGTGKTTFLHTLRKDCDKRMIVTAPTGVAAINAGGVTLHSFFQMPFGPFIPDSRSESRHKFNREKINIIKSLDLLVIDEISMVRADLLDGIDNVLRRYRRSDSAFGGVQLLLIGDLHQLAPVAKEEDWRLLKNYYDSPYFFNSRSLTRTELLSIELRHIYRQEDNDFIDLLNRVRDNNLDPRTMEQLNARCREDIHDGDDTGYITLCSHNHKADTINHSRLARLNQRSCLFEAEIDGEFPPHAYPTPITLELKEQAQVMFVRNDPTPEKRYFNGKIGAITHISGDRISIQCPNDSEQIVVEPATWENIEYSFDQENLEIVENKVGAFTQYPLKLAWAITIHKSQGLTFDRAIIDAQAAFAHGQVYVALSRCRTLEGLVLSSPLSQKAIKRDMAVQNFIENGQKNSPTREQLTTAKARYQQRLLLDCFDFQPLQFHLNRLVQLVDKSGDLIHVSGVTDLHLLQKKSSEELRNVGANFQRQLQGLFSDTILPGEDAAVIDRLSKASIYFQDKIAEGVGAAVDQLQLETDNKEIRKKARSLFKLLQLETAVKLAVVASCAKGFSVADYLRAISSAEIKSVVKKQKTAPAGYTEADIEHPELFHKLREWRAATASSENLAHFQVMHQKTLVQIAVNLPDSLSALLTIKGIGKKLAAKYGEDLVEIVSTYRTENKIDQVILPTPLDKTSENETPASATVTTKRPGIATRLISLELFEEGLVPSTIAEKRGLTVTTIENHLADCVEKSELSVDKLLPGETVQIIEQQLKKMEEAKLREIREALDGRYSYGEIRFVQAHLKAAG